MSESIDKVLEDILNSIGNDRERIEDYLANYPQYEQELRELLPIIHSLKTTGQNRPSQAFSQNAGLRLVEKLPKQPVTFWDQARLLLKGTNPYPFRRLSMPKIFATLIILIALAAGGVFSVDAAGPGDFLYDIDRGFEQIRLSFANTPEKATTLRLQFASERIEEGTHKLDNGEFQEATLAFKAYDNQVTAIAKLIATEDGIHREALLAMLYEALDIQRGILETKMENAPVEAREAIQNGINFTHFGPPEDAPFGPSEDLPLGPSGESPLGPAEDTPTGPPEEAPFGPPEEAPANQNNEEAPQGPSKEEPQSSIEDKPQGTSRRISRKPKS